LFSLNAPLLTRAYDDVNINIEESIDISAEESIDINTEDSIDINTEAATDDVFINVDEIIEIESSDGLVWHFDADGEPLFDLSDLDADLFFTWDEDFDGSDDLTALEALESELAELAEREYIMVYYFGWDETTVTKVYKDEMNSQEIHSFGLDDGFTPEIQKDPNDYIIFYYFGWDETTVTEIHRDELDTIIMPHYTLDEAQTSEDISSDISEDIIDESGYIMVYYFGWDETIVKEVHQDELEYVMKYYFGLGEAIDYDGDTGVYDELIYFYPCDICEPILMTLEQFYEMLEDFEHCEHISPYLSGAGDALTDITPFNTAQMTVSPTTWRPTQAAGFTSIGVTSNRPWSVTRNVTWLSISNVTGSGGNGSFRINTTAHTGTTARAGVVTVSATGISRTVAVTQSAPPTPTPAPSLTISQPTWNPGAGASNATINVTANRTWSPTSNQSWLTITNATGTSSNGSFRINVTANTGTAARTGVVTVSATGVSNRTVVVTQAAPAAPSPSLTISQSIWSAPAMPSSARINITSNTTWEVRSNHTWLTVSNITPANRSGNGAFTINFDTNSGTSSRVGVITVSVPGTTLARSVTVTQPAAVLNISTNVWTPTSAASNATINVTSNMAWNPTSNQSWLTILNITGVGGNGSFWLSATANTGTTARSATVTVRAPGLANRTITVTQAAPQPILTLSPSSGWPAPAAGGTSSVINITANRLWSITSSDATWLNATSISPAVAANRTGNGSFRITANTNPRGTSRTGRITVSGGGLSRIIDVTQAAQPATLSISPSADWSIGTNSASRTVTVTTNRPWNVSVSSSVANWLTVSRNNGPEGGGTFVVNATQNFLTNERTGTITVSVGGIAHSFRVTQAAAPSLSVPSSLSIGSAGGTLTARITSNSSWTAHSNNNWIRVTPASGSRDRDLTITVDPNATATGDHGSVTVVVSGIAPQTIRINRGAQITITFNANGGVGGPAPRLRHPGARIGPLPPGPTRDGHTFAGWFTHSIGGLPADSEMEIFSNITFWAQWIPIRHLVSFNLVGGRNGPRERTVPHGQGVGRIDEIPTRYGHTFDGWFTAQNGGNPVTTDTPLVTGPMTVFARWAPIEYTITFHLNGGRNGPAPVQRNFNTLINIPAITPTRTGHTFLGWFVSPNGGYRLSAATRTSTNHTDWWAMWAPQNFTVTFDANGGEELPTPVITRQYREAVGPLPTANRTGFAPVGWYTARTGGTRVEANREITANVTFFARWAPVDFIVTFNPQGGQVNPATQPVQAGTLDSYPTPTKAGHVFAGWHRNPNGGERITVDTVIDRNVTFFALWNPESVITITFDPNGGTVNPTFITRPVGAIADEMPTLVLAGHTFIGWFLGGTVQIAADTPVSVNMTVVARWQPIAQGLTITFNSNGGAPAVPSWLPIQPGVAIGPLPNQPRRQGPSLAHRFDGWFDRVTGEQILSTNIAGNSSIDAYARWTCNQTLWPTRIRHQWYRFNHVPIRSYNAQFSMLLGMANWNNSNPPVHFYESSIGNMIEVRRSTGTYLGQYRTLAVMPGVPGSVSSFSITICVINTDAYATREGFNINTVRASVIAHELGHAVGLRDGMQSQNGHPTILGGDPNASLMNAGRNRELINGPQGFDLVSVRLVYDDL